MKDKCRKEGEMEKVQDEINIMKKWNKGSWRYDRQLKEHVAVPVADEIQDWEEDLTQVEAMQALVGSMAKVEICEEAEEANDSTRGGRRGKRAQKQRR